MLFFQGELIVENLVDIYQLAIHPILLNLRPWCVILLNTHDYNLANIAQLNVPKELTTFLATLSGMCVGINWLEDTGRSLEKNTYKKLTIQSSIVYPPKQILILLDRILNLFQNT